MGCGECGGIGHDPHAAYRRRAKKGVKVVRQVKGSSEGVIKSAKRLALEAARRKAVKTPTS